MRSVLLGSMMILFCISCSSCARADLIKPSPFKDYYQQLSVVPLAHAETAASAVRLTFSATAIALPAFLRQLADEGGVSIISHKSLDEALVTLDVRDATVSEVLASVARRLDSRLTRIGNTWFIGPILPEDRGSLVRKVGRLSADQIGKILDSFKSDMGRFSTFSDGVIVVADRVEVLERLTNALDELEKLPANSWVCQLYLVQLNNSAKLALGLKTDYTAKFTANIASNTADSHAASLALSSLIDSSWSVAGSTVMAAPLMLVRDGSPAVIKYGNEVRLPRKTTSPYGTVEVTGYEVIQTGFSVAVDVRDDSIARGLLNLDLSLSSITGYQDGIPQLQKEQFTTAVSVSSGGTYLLGSLDLGTKGKGWEGNVLSASYSKSSDQTTLYIWSRVYKIDGRPLLSAARDVFDVPSLPPPPKS